MSVISDRGGLLYIYNDLLMRSPRMVQHVESLEAAHEVLRAEKVPPGSALYAPYPCAINLESQT